MSDSTVSGTVSKGGSGSQPSPALTPGQPWRGAKGPDGSSFEGWVLVQLWSPTTSSTGITVHWSGDKAAMFERAANELMKLKNV